MKQQQRSRKHHYIPRFYLERWTNKSGQLQEISWRYQGLVARATYPKGTGYHDNLNTLPGLPEELQTVLEDSFFMKIDGLAAEALKSLENDGGQDMSLQLRSAWSRMIIGFLFRHPNEIAILRERHEIELAARYENVKARYPEFRKEGDPLTWEEARSYLEDTQADERSFGILIQKAIDSPEIGKFINNMIWCTITLPALFERSFLTSDRPVIRSDGIAYDHSFLAVPLNPRKVFVAVNNQAALDALGQLTPQELTELINNVVVRQARILVFSHNTAQLRFIEDRLRRPSVTRPKC